MKWCDFKKKDSSKKKQTKACIRLNHSSEIIVICASGINNFSFCTDIDEQNWKEHWTILLYRLNFERLNPVKYCDISERFFWNHVIYDLVKVKRILFYVVGRQYNIYHAPILVKQFKWQEKSIWLKNRFVL